MFVSSTISVIHRRLILWLWLCLIVIFRTITQSIKLHDNNRLARASKYWPAFSASISAFYHGVSSSFLSFFLSFFLSVCQSVYLSFFPTFQKKKKFIFSCFCSMWEKVGPLAALRVRNIADFISVAVCDSHVNISHSLAPASPCLS